MEGPHICRQVFRRGTHRLRPWEVSQMIYDPEHLQRWTLPPNYFGAEWPDYFSSGVGQSRDSDALERSNFTSMLTALGGESETVIVVRETHWAVGWVEWIAIHQDDEKALKIADDIRRQLSHRRRRAR